MSKSFLKQGTNGCDTLNPFCSRRSLHVRFVSDIYECNQVHRYILCVVVIVCNEHWEQGIQIEMTCNSKVVFLVALISVNTI